MIISTDTLEYCKDLDLLIQTILEWEKTVLKEPNFVFSFPLIKQSLEHLEFDDSIGMIYRLEEDELVRFSPNRSVVLFSPKKLQSFLSNGGYESLFAKTQIDTGSLLIEVDEIDSFELIREVDPSDILLALTNARIDLAEDVIQTAFEEILSEPFHKKDWGGEINDLYTSHMIFRGQRTRAAFLLKGKGLDKRIMHIADCGKNGDQIQRLFQSPAEIFIVQYVGHIGEDVITDVWEKVELLRSRGKDVCGCIVNGQDTARILLAYGKISLDSDTGMVQIVAKSDQ